MALHDTGRINCKKGATTKNQCAGAKLVGKGCMLDDCVCVCVILLDMNTPS